MSSVVLDASALLALLKGEPGGTRVASVIGDAAISVFNLSEVVCHFLRAGMPTKDVEDMLNALPYPSRGRGQLGLGGGTTTCGYG